MPGKRKKVSSRKRTTLLSESHSRLQHIVRVRFPWLILGLAGGLLTSFLVSSFEELLWTNIQVAFFVPLIVYMSAAVGTQTETLFVREISQHRVSFFRYLWKELGVGIILGLILGSILALITQIWLKDTALSLTVGLAMGINVSIAPIVAILVPEILYKEHSDPALGAGPFTTVIQDFLSLLIYFLIAVAILWK